MSKVLITTSVLGCKHSGMTTPPLTAGQDMLMVNGQAVVAPASLAATFIGCTNTNASLGQKPCINIVSQTAGKSDVLMVNGNPVVLDTATGDTDCVPPPPPPGNWTVQTVNQDVLQTNDG